MKPCMRSPPKTRIRSSSKDRKNRELAGIALAARSTAELIVDSPRFVALGADDVQAAGIGDTIAEHDVGAAPGHVRRDGDAAALARRWR